MSSCNSQEILLSLLRKELATFSRIKMCSRDVYSMKSGIDPYLKNIFDPNASELENALARVAYREAMIGQSDIEKQLTDDNAELVSQVKKLQMKTRSQEGKYNAQCLITEQKPETNNRLISKAQEYEKTISCQKRELEQLGALLVKKYK